jgi:hypothetical protein
MNLKVLSLRPMESLDRTVYPRHLVAKIHHDLSKNAPGESCLDLRQEIRGSKMAQTAEENGTVGSMGTAYK